MLLSEVTLDNLQTAALRALQALEGANLYAPRPYPITVRPFAIPPTVIYQAADGGTYERDMTPELVGDTLNVVLGDRREVEAMTLWVPVDAGLQASFSAGHGMEGHQVKSGLIFRAGSYPDKGVEVTPDDIRRIVANFKGPMPVFLMSEHEDSLIGEAMKQDGAMVMRVWSEKADIELHADVQYPNWLAYGLRNLRNCVSVGLTAAKDGLRELSLVLNPRVIDAAVFRHEAAVAFSATTAFQTFKAAHPSEAANIATEAAKAPVPAPASDMDKPTFSQRLAALLNGKTPEQRAALTEAQIADAVFSDTPATPALPHGLPPEVLARIEAVETQNREFAAQRTSSADATDAANAYIRLSGLGKIDPVERDGFMTSFCAIRKSDRSEPTFSEGTQGPAEKAFVGAYEARSAKFRVGPAALPSTGAINLSTDSPLGPFKDSDFGPVQGQEAK